MKIKVVSDLHLEFSDVNIPNGENCDVLILSGDIMIAQDLHDHPEMDYGMYSNANLADLGRRQAVALRFRDFLKRVSFQFPHVIYIAGNHEFYHGRWVGSLIHLREECAKYPNVYFLERDTKVIDDVVFVGGTLWTDMNKGDPITLHSVRDMMNDFNVIKKDVPSNIELHCALTFKRAVINGTIKFFYEAIKNYNVTIIGLSHLSNSNELKKYNHYCVQVDAITKRSYWGMSCSILFTSPFKTTFAPVS